MTRAELIDEWNRECEWLMKHLDAMAANTPDQKAADAWADRDAESIEFYTAKLVELDRQLNPLHGCRTRKEQGQ